MKRIIFITLFIAISLITPIKAKIIEPINILDNFNICVISSSLGQRCKDINFNYINFFSSGKKTIEKNTINYEVDEWNYYFEIIKATNSKTIIKFTDQAKYATYYTVSLITLEKKAADLKWKFVSNETIYPKSEVK
jgi:hypothetical protein